MIAPFKNGEDWGKVSQSPVSVDCMIIDNNNVAHTDF